MTPSLKDVVAAVPKSGTPEKSSAPPPTAPADGDARAAVPHVPARRASARRLLAAAAAVLAVALLFLAYLQVSRTYPENSDESNDLLMAWDMLHGNVLLHGWYLSDVSFITTELPQYVLLVCAVRAAHRHRAHRGGDDLHPRRAPRRAAGQGPGVRPRGRAADAADGRPHVRSPARRRRLRPAAVPRAYRHGRAAPADLAGHRPVPGTLVCARRGRAAADLGARRRSAGAPGGRAAAGGGVRDARGPRAVPRPAARRAGAGIPTGEPARPLRRAVPGRGGHPGPGPGLA